MLLLYGFMCHLLIPRLAECLPKLSQGAIWLAAKQTNTFGTYSSFQSTEFVFKLGEIERAVDLFSEPLKNGSHIVVSFISNAVHEWH
jgi:hypothetical protein